MLIITGIVSNTILNLKPIAPTFAWKLLLSLTEVTGTVTVKKKFGYCKIQDKSGQITVTLTPLTMNNKTFAFILMCS